MSVIVGVDPHKDLLVAVAVDSNGEELSPCETMARPRGYKALLSWARQFPQRTRMVGDVLHIAGGLVRALLPRASRWSGSPPS